ncbi:MAG TPA: hypothetical protein VM866_04010 [Pyrinomonadaceae bacterium]|nr:hypothetical protein [Pyrinomonadaceae bacterium]
MNEKRNVRVIKREQRVRDESATGNQFVTPARAAQRAVTSWVREHRERAEEFRENYSTLLAEVGLALPGRRCES